MEQKILEKIGLTKNESRVYMTLLQLGTAKTGSILKASGLNSGKIYEILDGLKKKGLVSESNVNRVKEFTAAPPKGILEYIEKKKETLKQEEQIIREMLPRLEAVRKTRQIGVKAITYTGLKGMKAAFDECLEDMKPGEENLVMGATGNKDNKFNSMLVKIQKRRIERKIKSRMIFSEQSLYFQSYIPLPYTEARVLKGFTPVAVDVFGEDKVLILNYAEPCSCTLIYDKNTATSFRHFFEQLWKIAKVSDESNLKNSFRHCI